MNNGDTDLVGHLKSLEGNNYNSETALFDALYEIGVQLPKGYRSGSRNKDLARKEADRYIEYKPLREVEPNSKRKRAVIITKVRDPPKPKEDGRGTRGRYADYLRPLIVRTAMDRQFRGTKAELFDNWGVYDNYREEQIKNGLFNPLLGYGFNPWKIDKSMPPGVVKYHQVINNKERDSLRTSLDALSREKVILWSEYTMFAPEIKVEDNVNAVKRLKTWKEYVDDCDQRYQLITQLIEKEDCVLSPEVFKAGLYITREVYEGWSDDYYINSEKLPGERATEEQEMMYENYRMFIRQLTVYECSKDKSGKKVEKYCSIGEIPNEYELFSDWTYRRKYSELDKSWKKQLLGWEQIRRELYFKLIDEARAIKYLEAYAPELAFELGCEYILYMDEHMAKEKLYYPKNYTSDFEGVISSEGSMRLFPLRTSISAKQLHSKLKELFELEENLHRRSIIHV